MLLGARPPKAATIIVHANEHMGQSIAYARLNGIVPPGQSRLKGAPHPS
jgi:hypothetical protein